jgi:hypothetical protein
MLMITRLMVWVADPDHAFRAVTVLVCVAHLIATAQLLVNRALLRDESVLSWQCVRLRYRWFQSRSVERTAALVYKYPNVLLIISAKLLAAVALLAAAIASHELFTPLLALALINAVVTVRVPFGSNAADEMATITSVALLVGGTVRDEVGMEAALWFIAAQAVLAYSTAGIYKVSQRGWYDGNYLRDLFSTGSYGTAWVARVVRKSPKLVKVVGASVVIGESLFILLLFVPPTVCALGLALAVLFHVVIAAVMGLNLFVWSFGATYPAILFCNLTLHLSGGLHVGQLQ